ncbi:MAG: DUF3488 domain-containing protein, partial [Phycisphaeraceae bacterium]|nr:DUF3488 domain-containing protein [Phycisphaeraceae bacterium]
MTEDFDREHRKLWASTALLALGLSSLWHVAWMPAWELLVVGLLAAWRVTALWRSWRLPPRWVTWAVSLAIFAGLILELGDELVGPQAASLIVAMIWVKTLELRDRRDATVVCLVACFLPVSAAVLAFSLLASLWAALSLLVAMAALWRCRVGGGTWRRASLGASGLLARAAIPALILLLILPRPDVRGMLEELGMNRQETGLSDRLEPGSVAQLAQSEDLAFRASFNGEPPEGPWYWRAMVLWESRGLSWRIGACGHPGGLEDIARLDSEVSYQVTLEPHGLPWLVALDRPALPISEEGSRLMCGHVLRRDWPVNQRLQYEARSDLAESPRLMSPVHIDASRRLPDSLSVRARSLAAQLRGDQPQETARNILRWFAENGFAYTLDPGTMGGNELDQFLFQQRRG